MLDKNDCSKSAIIVGGANGVGLSLALCLAKVKQHVYVLDKADPSMPLPKNCTFYPCNLLDMTHDGAINNIKALSQNEEIDTLFITAGFGRVACFDDLQHDEIAPLMGVNTTAIIQIIKLFYAKIKANQRFYTGFMGSIAGLVNSPMFSVYAASKAALFRFAESVNTELEAQGCKNRILNVSPGSIQGTKFDHGENNLQALEGLSMDILDQLYNTGQLYIPKYEETYKNVLEKYQADPSKFGQESYAYKQQSGRTSTRKTTIGYLSGTWDLFHVGHLNVLKNAKKHCDYLKVGVHADASHKGKVNFIPLEERKAILSAIKYVDEVVDAYKEDSDSWEKYGYDKLFVGSDYKGTDRFLKYEEFFKDKGVEIVFFPYTKGTSSTQIREHIKAGS